MREEQRESEQRENKELNRRGDRQGRSGAIKRSLSRASTHQMYSQLSREERSSGFSCNKNETRLVLSLQLERSQPPLET